MNQDKLKLKLKMINLRINGRHCFKSLMMKRYLKKAMLIKKIVKQLLLGLLISFLDQWMEWIMFLMLIKLGNAKDAA